MSHQVRVLFVMGVMLVVGVVLTAALVKGLLVIKMNGVADQARERASEWRIEQ